MNAKLKVLIVEDSEDDYLLLTRMLGKSGYNPEVLRVDTEKAMIRALESRSWDVIISDYSMPSFNELKALKLVQKHKLDIPFIIVSGVIGESVAVEAMKAGAHDYLLKGNLHRLVPAIDREIKDAVERRKRREAEEALKTSLQELKENEKALSDKNIAMKEVLSQIESEKEETRNQISSNIEKLLIPTVRELKKKAVSIDKRHLDRLEKNLMNLVAAFPKSIRKKVSTLSPRQLEICNMVKSGMKNKEMADLMGISLRTVETHRNAIRKRLGISGDDTNLVTFLSSIKNV